MDSILTSIKKLIGIDESVTSFDMDLIIHINSVLRIINQIGVGKEHFSITGSSETWNEFIDEHDIEEVKTLVYLRVRLLFDPPSNSFVVTAIQDNIKELESRLNYKEYLE